jgi:integrase
VWGLQSDLLRDFLLLAVLTGLRKRSIAQLKRSDVKLKAKTLYIGEIKGRAAHNVPLSPSALKVCVRRMNATNSE